MSYFFQPTTRKQKSSISGGDEDFHLHFYFLVLSNKTLSLKNVLFIFLTCDSVAPLPEPFDAHLFDLLMLKLGFLLSELSIPPC